MAHLNFNKLVRDKIPDIIAARGSYADFVIVSPGEAAEYLAAKLSEEAAEYAESRELEELADVIEVVRGILHHRGVAWDELEQVRARKYDERGGFEAGILLKGVDD